MQFSVKIIKKLTRIRGLFEEVFAATTPVFILVVSQVIFLVACCPVDIISCTFRSDEDGAEKLVAGRR